MGKNTVASVLTALFVVAASLSAWYSLLYWKNARELRRVQTQANFIVTQQNILRSLVAESVEYSKRNADILPLLRSVGVNAQPEAKK